MIDFSQRSGYTAYIITNMMTVVFALMKKQMNYKELIN